jgi:ABC-type transport system substrate-binding protein
VGATLGLGMSARAGLVGVVLVVLGATAACASSAGSTSANHTPSKHTTAAADSSSPSPKPMLTPTAPAGTPLGAGERVWAAFSERGLTYDAWWAQLKPLLSASAQAVYVYDDPSKIPSMKLTGKIQLAPKAPQEAGYTARVVVPTSKGVFDLDLERHTLKSRWLLYAIKFPAGVQ